MLMSRGYSNIRDRINKNPFYNRSCFNCIYYYKKRGDDEELCHNNNVLEYDVCVDGNRIYCGFWGGIKNESRENDEREQESNNKNSGGLFKKDRAK